MSDRTKAARIIGKSLQDLQSRTAVKGPAAAIGGGMGNVVIMTLAELGPLTLEELSSKVAANSPSSFIQAVGKLTENHLITDQEPADGRLRLTERGRDLAVALQIP